MANIKRVGILTAGGDCPGLNAVIRAVGKKLIIEQGVEILGITDGYAGLITKRVRQLKYRDLSGILNAGGTILGTSNTANPYRQAVKKGNHVTIQDVSRQTLKNIRQLGIDCLVCIGGDGTMAIANRLYEDGIPVVGVPKTIDNDIIGTDITFGFNTAVTIATESIDRIHTTAQAHHRVMIVEVMGRNAGWIALHAGVASGGDIILLPEIPYHPEQVAQRVKERAHHGSKFSIIVISEGAKPQGGTEVISRLVKESTIQARLGGIAISLGEQLERITGLETRSVILGHVQRGGAPTAFDRVLATRLGTAAAAAVERRQFGTMVGVRGNNILPVPLKTVARGSKRVTIKDPVLTAARSVGTCFGDETQPVLPVRKKTSPGAKA